MLQDSRHRAKFELASDTSDPSSSFGRTQVIPRLDTSQRFMERSIRQQGAGTHFLKFYSFLLKFCKLNTYLI